MIEFRSNATSIINELKTSSRPLVITQHGKTAAVVVNPNEWQRIQDELSFYKSIVLAMKDLADGKLVPNPTSLPETLNAL